jgi:hypothetical protein
MRVHLGRVGHHALGKLAVPFLDDVQRQPLPYVLDVVIDPIHQLLRLMVVVVGLCRILTGLVRALDIRVLHHMGRWLPAALGLTLLVPVEDSVILAVRAQEAVIYLVCVAYLNFHVRWCDLRHVCWVDLPKMDVVWQILLVATLQVDINLEGA